MPRPLTTDEAPIDDHSPAEPPIVTRLLNENDPVFTLMLFNREQSGWTGCLTNAVGKSLAVATAPHVGRVLLMLDEVIRSEAYDDD